MTTVNKDLEKKCRIITQEFRVSYPHIFKPSSFKGGKSMYSVTMLFKKSQNLNDIKEVIKLAKTVKYGPNQKNWPTNIESPVTDGDHPKHAGKEGYKGCWAIKASTGEEYKPGLVDENAEPILDQGLFYPGCYARAQVFCRVWEFAGKTGIHFILDNVQKLRDGKTFSSKKAATEVFSPMTSGMTDEDTDTADYEIEEASEENSSFM